MDLGGTAFKYKFFRKKGSEFMLPEFLLKKLDQFKDFELRKDDVWIVSFPKSGIWRGYSALWDRLIRVL